MSASQTLLEMTQEILEQMQSDEVSSITDTAESTAVARIIRRTYWDLKGLENFPEHYGLFQLDETSSSTPTLMTIPTNCFKLQWVKYDIETTDNTDDQFVDMTWMELKDFLDRQAMLVESADNVSSFSTTGFDPLATDTTKILIETDRAPEFYTSPDDYNIIFDSYDSDTETYLRATKTLAYGIIDPVFTFSDSFTPDLDIRQYSLLFNEAKAQCFAELKQITNAKAEQRARRLMIKNQRDKRRVPDRTELDFLPNYGRK